MYSMYSKVLKPNFLIATYIKHQLHATQIKKKLVLLSVYSPVTLCVFVYKVIFAIFFDTKKHLNLQTVHHCVKIEIILILHKKKKIKKLFELQNSTCMAGFPSKEVCQAETRGRTDLHRNGKKNTEKILYFQDDI